MSAALTAATANKMLSVESRLFGTLHVAPEACIRFPRGIPGFWEERDFVLLPAGADGLFWLQSLRQPALAFFAADPFMFVPEYAPVLPSDLEGKDIAILALVTLPRGRGGRCTVNLKAPIVIDLRSSLARQEILEDDTWPLAKPVDLRAALRPFSSGDAGR
jgi:flagellar assembly factor FliW